MFEIRAALDGLAAGLAAERITEGDEIFSDYDEAKFCQVLKDVEWLIPAKNRNTTLKRHGGSPLRFYKVIGSVPPTEWEETE